MRRFARIFSLALAGLVLTVALAATFIYFGSEQRLTRRYDIAAPPNAPIASRGDTARGRHLATAILICAECHGPDLGGQVMVDAPPLRIAAANLTRGRGGVGAALTYANLDRAVRHGVRADGRPLLLMPSDAFTAVSDADLAALGAFLQTVPPVDREVGQSTLRPLGRALLVAGVIDEIAAERIDHRRRALPFPPADTLEHGQYLADVSGCSYCHLPSLEGRTEPFGPPNAPIAPSLKARTAGWTEADFVRTMRTGRTPDGRAIDSFMPWKFYGKMTDDELHALWRYVETKTRASTPDTVSY
jgi:mono/diheme cytochrome c family protein